MIQWEIGTVAQVVRTDNGIQELRVRMQDGTTENALHYLGDGRPPLSAADVVLMNTTAVRLGLGTGGYHFIHALLPQEEKAGPSVATRTARILPDRKGRRPGHVMKLRYTSLQRAVLAAEEPDSPHHGLFKEQRSLEGMPVLIGDVHSMLPVSAAWLRRAEKERSANLRGQEHQPLAGLRLVYVMGDGGALPLSFSRHVAELTKLGWLQGTVTYGHAYGGDLETVNKFTALLAARHALKADIAIAVMGPGIAGTGTPLGHSGIEAGELVNAVSALGGIPVIVPRISFADSRNRHRGLSHHTVTSLATAALAKALVPLPAALRPDERDLLERQLEEHGLSFKHDIRWFDVPAVEDVETSLSAYPVPVTTMGRSLRDDPAFFQAACAAAQAAWELCRGK
mgnify:CR=1 FL=1